MCMHVSITNRYAPLGYAMGHYRLVVWTLPGRGGLKTAKANDPLFNREARLSVWDEKPQN